MRHEGPFFLFKSEKKTDEGQLKQMRAAPRIYSFFFFCLTSVFCTPKKKQYWVSLLFDQHVLPNMYVFKPTDENGCGSSIKQILEKLETGAAILIDDLHLP